MNEATSILEQVNIFDIASVAILIFFGVRGLIRGLSEELEGLVVLFSSLFAAWRYHPLVAEKIIMHTRLSEGIVSDSLAYIALFIGIGIAAKLIMMLVSGILQIVFKGPVERIGGIVAGLAQGLGIIALVILLATAVNVPIVKKHMLEESKIGNFGSERVPEFYNKLAEKFNGLPIISNDKSDAETDYNPEKDIPAGEASTEEIQEALY